MTLTNRVALELGGGHAVYWYGVMVASGFLLAMLVMQWLAPRFRVPRVRISDIVVAAMVGGMLGARALYVLSNWDAYRVAPHRIFMIWEGGLVFYGGLIGAALAVVLLGRWLRLDLGGVADLTAIALPLGQALGRVGCFLNGCCFGPPAASGPRVTYLMPPFEQVWQTQHEQGWINPENVQQFLGPNGNPPHHCLPVLPVQLYLGAMDLVVFAALLALGLAWRARRGGQLLALYLVLCPAGRFVLEFWRGDYPARPGGLTPAQWAAVLLVPLGVVLFFWRRRAAPAPAPASAVAAKASPGKT